MNNVLQFPPSEPKQPAMDLEHKLYLHAFGSYELTTEDVKELEEHEANTIALYHRAIDNLAFAFPFSPTWWKLLRVRPISIYGPKEAKDRPEWHGMTNMAGQPAFVAKELDGKFYYFSGYPNPGFPGS